MADRTRRANGAGSITQRDDGALIVRITVPGGDRVKRIVHRGIRDDGRPETPAQHRGRAEKVLAALKAEATEPSTLHERWTVARWAHERYLPSIEPTVKPNTYWSYRKVLDLYVLPHVGRIELSALTVDQVDDLDRTLAANGYSMVARRHARGVLGRVIRHAVRKRRITHDVTVDADKLRGDDTDRLKDSLEPEQVRAILTAARGTEWEPMVALLANLGLRRGEVLGLAWGDIDLDEGTVTVRRNRIDLPGGVPHLGTPKTAGSVRTLALRPGLLASLRAHRVRQAERQVAAGSVWVGGMEDDRGEFITLAFTDEAGRPLPPHRLNTALARIAVEAGVGHVNPHRLRHSAASLMLAEGVDHAAVAAVLGHASPQVTLSVYSHALRGKVVQATDAIGDAIGSW